MLTVVYLLCFVGSLSAALFAFSQRGYVHEHVLLGIRLPTVLAALPVMMAVCAALSWLHFRRDAYYLPLESCPRPAGSKRWGRRSRQWGFCCRAPLRTPTTRAAAPDAK